MEEIVFGCFLIIVLSGFLYCWLTENNYINKLVVGNKYFSISKNPFDYHVEVAQVMEVKQGYVRYNHWEIDNPSKVSESSCDISSFRIIYDKKLIDKVTEEIKH
jgi:hypothetical protein